MLILALEGALARCSAAILRDGAVLAAGRHDAPRGHPAILPPLVEQVLAEAGLKPAALDAVAVGIGPGGFTGLRTAIALAEGMAQALGKPLIGVTTGEALVAELPEAMRGEGTIWSVLDQRQGRVVLEIFPPGAAMPEAPVILPIEALPNPEGAVVLVGDAAEHLAPILAARGTQATAHPPAMPSAEAVGLVAARRLAGLLPARGAAPLYAEPAATTAPSPAA
jgi:tRNA threonylcarbamoyladenosine biosynthesis protein TsaB